MCHPMGLESKGFVGGLKLVRGGVHRRAARKMTQEIGEIFAAHYNIAVSWTMQESGQGGKTQDHWGCNWLFEYVAI